MARITYGNGKVLQPTSKEALLEHMIVRSAARGGKPEKCAEVEGKDVPPVQVTIYAPTVMEFFAKNKK